MKICPKCNQTFSSDNSFCLMDGSTLILTNETNETLSAFSTGNDAPTQFIPTPVRVTENQSSSIPGWVYFVMGIMGTALVGLLVFVFVLQDDGKIETATVETNNSSENINQSGEPSVNKLNQYDGISEPSPRLENRRRYIIDSCGSIQDTRTGLEWLVGIDKNTTWYEAQEWTSDLNNCGGGWRMPTINEIRTLYDPSVKAGTGYYTNGRYFPAHIDPVFNAIGGGSWVWASQKLSSGNAYSLNLNQGKAVEFSATNTLYSTRAFALRKIKN